jgi:hypothetical protein
MEINSHLRKEQQHLKEKKMKMRNGQIQLEEIKRREDLNGRIEEKKKRGHSNKVKHLEKKVKSMT